MKPDIILFGPQGSGKGTQAEKLVSAFGYRVIGTGGLMREYAKHRDKFGKTIKRIIERGELVPDETIGRIFSEELTKIGTADPIVFDGFPRNLNQARLLDQLATRAERPLPLAVYLQLPRGEVFKRLASRYVCADCGTLFQSLPGPLKKLVCPKCGREVEMRKDDRPEIIETRLNLFYSQTYPLVSHYQKLGRLKEINGQATIDHVHAAIVAALGLAK